MRLLSFLLALLFSINSYAAGLSAPFSGSKLTGLTRSSTIAEYDSTVDHSGNLIDISGSNYFTYSSQFDNAAWTKAPATASISADAIQCPIGSNDADLFVEGTAGSGDTNQIVGQTSPTLTTGTYTLSIYVLFKTGGRSWFILRNAGAANKDVFFNIQTGVVGTVESAVTAYAIQPVGGGWYRLSMQTTDSAPGSTWAFRTASADNTFTYTGDGRGAVYVCGAQLAKNDEWHQGPGVYHPTVAANKPLLDLAPTASPTESKSYFQGQDGRRLKARTFNGTTQYYSKAHDASMNVFTSPFTLTVVYRNTDGENDTAIFDHQGATGGFQAVFQSSTLYGYLWNAAGATVNLVGPASAAPQNYWSIGQIVRTSGSIGKIFVNGAKGNDVNIPVGYGADLSNSLFIGTSNAAGGFFGGDVLYTRLDTEALTDVQLAKEREIIQGTLFGSGNLNPGSTFSRTTTAIQTFSDGTLGYVAAGVPRVSGDGGGVLVEEQRTNIAKYSGTFTVDWAATRSSLAATSVVLPDGSAGTSNTFHEGPAADGSTTHYLSYGGACSMTTVPHTLSIYMKKANRSWVNVRFDDTDSAMGNAFFNLDAGITGTVTGAGVTAGIIPLGNGWYRGWITATPSGAGNCSILLFAASDGATTTFVAADQDSTYIYGAQVELGAHPTSYIPTTSASVTRTADNLTIEPWKVTKPVVGTPNFAMYFDNDVYSGGTYTSEVGNYTFTVAGDTKHVESQTLGDYFSFDGTGDNLSITGTSDFSPATSFSLTTIVTPATVSGTHAIATNYAGATYGWELFQTGDDVTLYIYNAGGNTSVAKADCLVANKTSLITVSFTRGSGGSTADSTTNIYVDGLAVATSSAQRVPVAATGLMIGDSGGTEPYNGKIHYMSFHSGTVLSSAQHTAMYNAFKQANVLPLMVGHDKPSKKLILSFDAKCAWASTTDIGLTRDLVGISGNTGTALGNIGVSTRNMVSVKALSNGRFIVYVNDDEAANTVFDAYSVVKSDWNKWHSYVTVLDFADMANSTLTIDGVNAITGTDSWSGTTHQLSIVDAKIRIGVDYAGTANGNCSFRNLRMRATP